MEWHQTHGNHGNHDVFDFIPLIPLQSLPQASPPLLKPHQPPVMCSPYVCVYPMCISSAQGPCPVADGQAEVLLSLTLPAIIAPTTANHTE